MPKKPKVHHWKEFKRSTHIPSPYDRLGDYSSATSISIRQQHDASYGFQIPFLVSIELAESRPLCFLINADELPMRADRSHRRLLGNNMWECMPHGKDSHRIIFSLKFLINAIARSASSVADLTTVILSMSRMIIEFEQNIFTKISPSVARRDPILVH